MVLTNKVNGAYALPEPAIWVQRSYSSKNWHNLLSRFRSFGLFVCQLCINEQGRSRHATAARTCRGQMGLGGKFQLKHVNESCLWRKKQWTCFKGRTSAHESARGQARTFEKNPQAFVCVRFHLLFEFIWTLRVESKTLIANLAWWECTRGIS